MSEELEKMKKHFSSCLAMDASEYYTVKELSILINVKAKTIYSWAAKGAIPFYRLLGVLRFKKQEIHQWLTEQCRE